MTDERAIAFCAHCGNEVPQTLVSYYPTPKRDKLFCLVSCETCGQPLFYVGPYPERVSGSALMAGGPSLNLKSKQLLWPPSNQLHPCVPQSVRECYEEAAQIKSRSPHGFANQIRRALEALCIDRNAKGNVLAQQLKDLGDKGEIPPKLTEMTDILRLLGNLGSHAAKDKVHPEFVPAIDEFFRAVVEYVYVAPHRVNEVLAAIDFAKRTGTAPGAK